MSWNATGGQSGARPVPEEGGWRWWCIQRPGKPIRYVYARTLKDAERKANE